MSCNARPCWGEDSGNRNASPKESHKKNMSYTRLIYHIVFRTRESLPTINEQHETELYRYIWGLVRNKGGVLGRINGMPDHIHMLVELPADQNVSDFVRTIKISTNNFCKAHADLFPHFQGWAKKYCALTYGINEREKIVNYIKGQKEHHKKESFPEELERMLQEFHIKYDERYLHAD